MKHLLAAIILLLLGTHAQAQQYIPMPADSATWRYRTIELDDTNYLVIDVLLLVKGHDTAISGNAYHVVYTSTHSQIVGASSYPPPVVDDTCLYPDAYFTAIREGGKKVYEWTGSTEKLMYDFTAATGGTMPAPGGATVTITSTDSVLLGGVWHKRYQTSNTNYYVIEGVGASTGLLPSYYAPGYVTFHCFTYTQFHFSPAGAPNCTTIYPKTFTGLGYTTAGNAGIIIYPQPAQDVLHIKSNVRGRFAIYSMTDNRSMTPGLISIDGDADLHIDTWPAGIYYLVLYDAHGKRITTQKVIKR